MIVGFLVYVLIRTFSMTKEQCGADACGYAMLGVFLFSGIAFMLYLFGIALASFTFRNTHGPELKPDREMK